MASIFDHIKSLSSGVTGAGIAGTLTQSFSGGKIKSESITKPLYAGMLAAYVLSRLASKKPVTKQPEAPKAKESTPNTNKQSEDGVQKEAGFTDSLFVRSFILNLASE
ncbi:MAG: hypothetical protein EBU84_00350 [Actinobacteria bacterium]|nr:hypothetical protein [Actinomycetota bacterium]